METVITVEANGQRYDVRVVIAPHEEFPGVWRADLPELDYWAQARSPTDAVEAAREVAGMLLSSNPL